jgi:hypothetical protein
MIRHGPGISGSWTTEALVLGRPTARKAAVMLRQHGQQSKEVPAVIRRQRREQRVLGGRYTSSEALECLATGRQILLRHPPPAYLKM